MAAEPPRRTQIVPRGVLYISLLHSHHHVKVPMEQTATSERGATGRGLPGVQARRQWLDVCALGLLCVPQPHGDQTQPVVATPELGDGRLLCSCRSCPSLRLRGRSSFRLGHRADLPDGFPGGLVQRKAEYATLIHALKVQLGSPASTKGSIVSHVPSSRLEGSFDGPPPPTLRWRSSRVEARQRRQKLRAGG